MITNSTVLFPASTLRLPSTSLNGNAARKVSIYSSLTPSIDQHTPSPPKYPSYLKLTTYPDLVHEQYEAMNRQQSMDNDLALTQQETDIDDQLASLDLRLPSMWNDKDRARHIAVDTQGLILKYVGPGKSEAHAGSIRANFPMPPQAGLFYYEVEILSKGEDGYIGIGFCTKENDLERLPGWDVDSFGYHGDDGHGFAGSGIGNTFGPKFTTGDIVGCGINFADASAFYTKNGRWIDTAFSSLDLSKQYYPVLGLRTPGERVKTNFGEKGFIFDVELYIKDHATLLWKDVMQTTGSPPPIPKSTPSCQSRNDMAALVVEYLLHHGYESTSRALVKDRRDTSKESPEQQKFDEALKEAKQRQDIRNAIMEGHIEKSIWLTDLYYPNAFNRKGITITFELRYAEIMEIMRKYTSHRQASYNSRLSDSMPEVTPKFDYDYLHHQLPINYPPHWIVAPQNINQQSRHISWGSGATHQPSSHTNDREHLSFDPENDDRSVISAHDRDADMAIPSPISSSPTSTCSSSSYTHYLDSSTGLGLPITSEYNSTPTTRDSYEELLLNSARALGQRLQNDYGMSKQLCIKKKLSDIVSLLADPENSMPLDPSYRNSLMSKLNSAILESQSRSSTSSLEKIYQQTVVVNKYLAREGNGTSVLLKADTLDRMTGAD